VVIKLNYKIPAAVLAIVIFMVTVSAFVMSVQPASSDGVQSGGNNASTVCVPILMYHEVKPTEAGKDVILPYEFESDLKYLQSNGYVSVKMADLIAYVYDGTPLPEKTVVLSFDDGYLNNYVYVFPLLKKYHMKIVLSIIGKNTDDFTNIPDNNINYSHVTWTQINEMLDSGCVELQNHTYNMHKINRFRFGCGKKHGESQEHYAQALTDDIGRLQDEIRLFTGYTPNTFTYPYGQISSDSLPVIKSLGFKASLSCTYGVNLISRDPSALFGLRRICRSHGVSAKKSIDDAMKTLKYRKTNITP